MPADSRNKVGFLTIQGIEGLMQGGRGHLWDNPQREVLHLGKHWAQSGNQQEIFHTGSWVK